MADIFIVTAVQPTERWDKHEQMPARVQRREGRRELRAIVVDVLEHIDIDDRVEVLPVASREKIMDGLGPRVVVQRFRERRIEVVGWLESVNALRVPFQEQLGNAAVPGAHLGNNFPNIRRELLNDPTVIVNSKRHRLQVSAWVMARNGLA